MLLQRLTGSHRGILYIVWGNYDKKLLKRSIESHNYDYVVRIVEYDNKQGYQNRIQMYNLSPFDTTLHLDCDTVVKGDLSFGFEMAEKYDIACCIAPASSNYHASKGEIRNLLTKDSIQLNCGVIFFKKSKLCAKIFTIYSMLISEYKEASVNDQPYFSFAVYKNMNPFILSRNWNWRKNVRYESKVIHGDLRIIHAKRI